MTTYTFFNGHNPRVANGKTVELSEKDLPSWFDAEINSEECPHDMDAVADRLAKCWGCRWEKA